MNCRNSSTPSPRKWGWIKSGLLGAALALFGSSAMAQAATYDYASSIGTYTPISGGTVLFATGAVYDDNLTANQTINPFTFNGTVVTTFSLNTNGWIALGGSAATTTGGYTPLSSAITATGAAGILAPFGRDQQNTATSEIRWEYLSGTNETVIQYKDVRRFGTTGDLENYQIRLDHGTNQIRFVYGTMTVGSSTTSPQVGIKSGVAAGVIGTTQLNLTLKNIPAGTSCLQWDKAVRGRLNSETMLYSSTAPVATVTSGTTFTFSPQGGLPATWVNPVTVYSAVAGITSSAATISWTAPTNADRYNVQFRRAVDCAWTNFTGNPVTGITATLTGLIDGTTYHVRIQPYNSATSNTAGYSHIPPQTGGTNTDGYVAAGTFTTLQLSCIDLPSLAGGTAAASVSSGCGSVASSTLSVAGSTNALGLTYQWYSGPVGGPYTTPLGTAATQVVTAVTSTTAYVRDIICSGGPATATSSEVVVTVNPTITAGVSASPTGPFCPPVNTTLTATGGLTYTWAPATGLSATTGDIVTSTAASTTTYTVTATGVGGCTGTANVTVTVNQPPTIASVTANPNPTCFNGNSQLNVTAVTPVVANAMTFAASTGGLDPMTGATTVLGTGIDDTPSALQNIGFTFMYNEVPYTEWSSTPDGFIKLGTPVATADFSNGITENSNMPKIMPYYDDMATGTTGNITSVVTGTAPNRILVVQWFVTIPRNTSGAANSTFQCWLYESTGAIEFHYGTMGAGSMSASVGIAATTTNYQSVTIAGPTVSTVAANDLNAGQPAAGTMYSFTNPTPTYLWTPNAFLNFDNIANPVASGVNLASQAYTVTATAASGCASTGTVTLTTTSPITAATITGTLSYCAGGSTTLTAVPTDGAGPYTYLWSPGGETTASINATAPGSYSAQVTDNCGGSVNTGSVSVTENALPAVGVTPPTADYCVTGPVVQLTASGADSYTWAPAAGLSATTGTTVDASPASTTTYTVSGTDANGCVNTATATVNVGTYAAISSVTATPGTVCAGEPSQLQVNLAGGAYCTTINFTFDTEPISNVTFADINNSSGCPINADPDLQDFTSVVGNVVAGNVYAMTCSGNTGGSFTTFFTAFFDWDQNGTFESSQAIGSINNTVCTATASNNVTVPLTALNGNTRMRVVKNYNASPTDPCGTYGYGQAEDYTLNVTGGQPGPSFSWAPAGDLNNAAIANPVATILTENTSVTYTVTVTNGFCVSTGTATVTTPLVNDGDPCTLDACVGGVVSNTFQDADGDGICDANDDCPNLSGEQGDPCDDGLATTGNDVINGSCVCQGQLIDCLGVPGGAALPGTACDDGNATTGNDVYQPNCTCAGQPLDCLGVPGGTTLPGTACDDGDANTISDVYDANCVCAGTPIGGCSENNVVLTLNSDANANQTTWNIIDAGTQAIVCSGDAPTNNSVIIASCCLADGCYSLQVFDSMGDGINPGGFVLRDANDIRIIDNVNNGNTFTSLSKAAPSFCVPLGTDALTAGSCDQMSLAPNGTLTCVVNPAVSAQYNVTNSTSGYQWHIFNPHGGYTRMIFLAHNTGGGPNGATKCATLKLADIVTLPVPQNVVLNVRVRSRVAGTYAPWGGVCRMRVGPPPCATTKLVDDINNPNYSCGVTRTFGGNQYISAINVLGVNRYQFRFERVGGGYIRTIASPNTNLTLAWNTLPLVAGNTYNVTVRVSYDGGSTYCPYGASCTVAIVAPPVAQARTIEVEEMEQISMQLYPNPNRDGLVTVRMDVLKPDIDLVSLDVNDLFGKRVHAEQLPVSGTLNSTLDLSGLASGVYLVTLTAGSEQWNQRLVIQR